MKPFIATGLIIIALAACAPWPPHAHHQYPVGVSPSYGVTNLHQDRWELAVKEVAVLKSLGAASLAPAAWDSLLTHLGRTEKALTGGLEKAFETDLARLELMLDGVRSHLRGALLDGAQVSFLNDKGLKL